MKIVSVDSDGNIHELTGLFIEASVNAPFPYEVQAGNDIPYMLSKYPVFALLVGWTKGLWRKTRWRWKELTGEKD